MGRYDNENALYSAISEYMDLHTHNDDWYCDLEKAEQLLILADERERVSVIVKQKVKQKLDTFEILIHLTGRNQKQQAVILTRNLKKRFPKYMFLTERNHTVLTVMRD